MKQVLLDTSFILSCMRHKIDFIRDLTLEGMEILVPKEVIEEIKKIQSSRKKDKDKKKAKICLRYLEKNQYKEIILNSDKKPGFIVDKGIMQYAMNNPEVIIATLDKNIKKSISNQKLIITRKKRLEIVN